MNFIYEVQKWIFQILLKKLFMRAVSSFSKKIALRRKSDIFSKFFKFSVKAKK